MPRIKSNVASDRAAFVTELFKTNPELTIAEANDHLSQRDGFKMNLSKIYGLRKAALESIGAPVPTRPRKA